MAFDPGQDDIMDMAAPTREDVWAAQQATYEKSVAKRILRAAGFGVGTDRVLGGDSELTMEKIREVVDLPLRLVAKHIKVGKSLKIAMEGKITKTSVWKEFQLIQDCIPSGFVETSAIGLVFPWAGDTRHKVFHNCIPPAADKLSRHGSWYRVRGALYFLEDLADAMEIWLDKTQFI